MAQLTTEIVHAAIEGLEARKRHIDDQIAELRAMLSVNGNQSATSETATPKKKGRKGEMSAAGRKAIAEAQRKRWAAKKAAMTTSAEGTPQQAKRRLSAAGRRAIAQAQKKRWAAKKGATK